ncbi:uncharacterized protein LOC123675744 isoform X2 [Harmonia axyridis]|uniref:uncharacterized protein LOC123675744 isoform X2 n=1 Tax=Harmonia axyridis TaxID=115357 RepID=UPI001E276FA0|nr:uncharacterized protein LOC123675744 isoform X2 [Harmonia axyridis]
MMKTPGICIIKSLVVMTLTIASIQGNKAQPNYGFISKISAEDGLISHNFQNKRIDLEHKIIETQKTILKPKCLEPDSSTVLHKSFERSDDQLFSNTRDGDKYILYKNIEEALDSNDVELSARHTDILPSKTRSCLLMEPSTSASFVGEEIRVNQARSLTISITPTSSIAHQNIAPFHNHLHDARQVNPDIHDIITGIVKLLNGNVNVQANTVPVLGRPMRPTSSRINNRGPPRISDLPALPIDFDMSPPALSPPPVGQIPPPVSSKRLPTPYPFYLPPPTSSSMEPYDDYITGHKPSEIYIPTVIPPWIDRFQQKRPELGIRHPIPAYKHPDPSHLTTEKQTDDIFTLHLDMPSKNEEDGIEETATLNSYNEKSGHESAYPEGTKSSIFENLAKQDNETFDFEKIEKKIKKENEHSNNITGESKTSLQNSLSVDISTATPLMNSSSQEITNDIIEEQSKRVSDYLASDNQITQMFEISASPTESSIRITIPMNNETIFHSDEEIALSTISVVESSEGQVIQAFKEVNSSNFISPTSVLFISATNGVISTLRNSTAEHSTYINVSQDFPYNRYTPRPGIVLDDTEYQPGSHRQPIHTKPPVELGDIFDITVSAMQGPGDKSNNQGKPYVIPVDIDNVYVDQDVITSLQGENGFVSIDGKRTYLNLFGEVEATKVPSPNIKQSDGSLSDVIATGYAIPESIEKISKKVGSIKPTQIQRRPLFGRPKPNNPPVRIDTCIVGDDSTCDISQHEMCLTDNGISACHCRPGFTRNKLRDVCRKIVSVLLSLRVDRIHERKVVWLNELSNRNSDIYQQLAYEAGRAIESAMSMTPFSDEYLGAKVNSIYSGERSAGKPGVFVNLTIHLDENADTSRPTVKGDIQKHLLGVIQRRSNNVGKSALWVDSPVGSVLYLQDLDECASPELHDCHQLAKCINVFGGFRCECEEGYRDEYLDSKYRAGRHCEQCPNQYCNNRGKCRYQDKQEVCECSGNYYGYQCELDGEVLGVAIGASVTAIIIIGLTLLALVMWSRKWQREQKACVGSPVFGYMAAASNTVKTPIVGGPPYQLTLEERLRWAQLADVMAQTNHYASEPVAPTRPSSALFGYPSISSVQRNSIHGTLPPVPLPRLTLQAQIASRTASLHEDIKQLENFSSSEEEDKADLLDRSFQVPRPKSRSNASITNRNDCASFWNIWKRTRAYRHIN